MSQRFTTGSSVSDCAAEMLTQSIKTCQRQVCRQDSVHISVSCFGRRLGYSRQTIDFTPTAKHFTPEKRFYFSMFI
jgi:hypothetical protein